MKAKLITIQTVLKNPQQAQELAAPGIILTEMSSWRRGRPKIRLVWRLFKKQLHSSVGKESACHARKPGSIPGSGRSAGEGISYPLQYSWASLVAQLVKNPPEMRETWVWSLGWEDLLEKGKATHSSILAWRIPWTVQSMGSQRVRHNWLTFTFHLKKQLDLQIFPLSPKPLPSCHQETTLPYSSINLEIYC